MPWSTVALLITAVLAVVTVTAAVIAVRAVREVRRSVPTAPETLHSGDSGIAPAECFVPAEPEVVVATVRPAELAPRLVEGRVIVPPTQDQVLATALGRPGVRANVILFGLAHALRAENRDRIVALMRREYRRRRRERLRAGREAARVVPIRRAS